MNYAREMGLGEKTGINVPNEFSGRLPFEKSGFALNRMSSHGDDFEVTALQLATLVSAMGNGGQLLMPSIPRTPQDAAKFKGKVRRQIEVEPETWRRMVPGMVGAVITVQARRLMIQCKPWLARQVLASARWAGSDCLPLRSAGESPPRGGRIGRGPDARGHFPPP